MAVSIKTSDEIEKMMAKKSVLDAFLLGFVIYAVFDLTNMVIFKKWDLMTSLMDMTWGGVLFASTTYLTYKL